MIREIHGRFYLTWTKKAGEVSITGLFNLYLSLAGQTKRLAPPGGE